MKNNKGFDLDNLGPGRYELTLEVDVKAGSFETLVMEVPGNGAVTIRTETMPYGLGHRIIRAERVRPELVVDDLYTDNDEALYQVIGKNRMRQLTGVGNDRNARTHDFEVDDLTWEERDFQRVEIRPVPA